MSFFFFLITSTRAFSGKSELLGLQSPSLWNYVCKVFSTFTWVPVSISTFLTEPIIVQALLAVSKHKRDFVQGLLCPHKAALNKGSHKWLSQQLFQLIATPVPAFTCCVINRFTLNLSFYIYKKVRFQIIRLSLCWTVGDQRVAWVRAQMGKWELKPHHT